MGERIPPRRPKPSLLYGSSDPLQIDRMRFAGSWYPEEAGAISEIFAASGGNGRPALAVVPHAGLRYSARGQRALWSTVEAGYRDRLDGVVVIAPSHYAYLPPDIAVGGTFDAHETPVGLLPDLTAPHLADSVTENDAVPSRPPNVDGRGLGDRDEPWIVEREHAVELLLPGLRRVLGDVPVAALVVGRIGSAAAARSMAHRVLARLDETGRDGVRPERVLWLVSSDGTHYGRRFSWQPFGDRRWNEVDSAVRDNDIRLITPALSLDLDRYWEGLATEKSTVCGRYALGLGAAIVERLVADGALEIDDFRLLDYYSSADDEFSDGNDTEFVCYPTAVLNRSIPA